MRVLLLTSGEPLYLPRYLDPILRERGDDVARVVVAPFPADVLTSARRQFGAFGPLASLRLGAKYARGLLLDALPSDLGRAITGRHYSVEAVSRHHDVPVETVPDVNDPSFVDRVRDLAPDVLLSIVCGQRIGRELRDVPEYSINVHGSLLPRYRGRATAFWPLYYGDDEAGATAHLLTEEWDAGPIVDQRSFPLGAEDAVNDVYRKLADVGSTLALDVLDAAENGSIETRSNPTTEEDYHSLPMPAERRAFRRRGNRFV